MPVPPFIDFWLPVLRHISDGRVYRPSDLVDVIAEGFGLTPEDRADRIPSGKTRVYDRIQWTITYFRQSGLIASARRGEIQITDRGRQLLLDHPDRIGRDTLLQFPEFQAFVARRRREQPVITVAVTASAGSGSANGRGEARPSGTLIPLPLDSSPEEIMGRANDELVAALASELLDTIKANSPGFFENLVVRVLIAMGYGGSIPDAGQVLGRTGDGGIDGVIREDKLGLDSIYVQAKRWDGTVGRPIVQAFVGSLMGQAASKGVLLTTGSFSQEAQQYVKSLPMRVVLVDGPTLARLMIEHRVGVTVFKEYQIMRVDSNYFAEE
jgi:restriction system protein